MSIQESFSTLFGSTPYASDEAAKAARNARYKELKAQGYKATRSTLTNQLRQYASFGVPDGRSCTVYYVTAY
jgi:hypothetical protein